MRNYWLKIIAGMLGVFAVGMIIIAVVRQIHGRVHTVVESSDPISIPLAFVPFRVDGEQFGQVKRLVFFRSAPKQVTGVEVVVEIADSLHAEQLAGCALAIDDLENLNDRTTFRCVRVAADTAGRDLAPFGAIRLDRGGEPHQLLIPQSTARELRNQAALGDLADSLRTVADSISAVAESIADAVELHAESLAEAEGIRADSIAEFYRQRADSIRAAVDLNADSIRAAAERRADSIRHAAGQH